MTASSSSSGPARSTTTTRRSSTRGRLKAVADTLHDDLLIVMRAYFEKPRTTVGWKGYINDPHLDGSFAINEGLERARRLLLELTTLGLPAGTEFLDLLSPQFIADLIAWGAIGARTTESQSHRQLASGLSCPVGFKNGTDGSIQVAADAILAARGAARLHGHDEDGHGRHLRDPRQRRLPRHPARRQARPTTTPRMWQRGLRTLRAAGLREQVMIDVSHGNSGKQHLRQIDVAHDVAAQIAAGERRIVGVMIESHLEAGRQDLAPGVPLQHGVSITDACLGFAQTVPLLHALAAAVRARRRQAGTAPSA